MLLFGQPGTGNIVCPGNFLLSKTIMPVALLKLSCANTESVLAQEGGREKHLSGIDYT